MKLFILAALSTSILLLNSCNNSDSKVELPIQSGTVLSGTIWERPLSSPSNGGTGIKKGLKVDIYDHVAVIHNNDNSKRIVPLSRISKLEIK